ncbi:hypothetical protein B0T17DRAFT_489790 [Bombardia bombarda]|uniref:Uncharacterized protein n=1 Tax=Bombardia bombarda TaxID=252184 RepID=A0AA40C816_9PEZI|nr:hypothetical protein B0T17DRAFT_489790 [Bombardia bombarda]
MAWELSSWLVLFRTFQLLGSLTSAVLNGFLFAFISTKHIGLSETMVILELLIVITFLYSTLAIWVQHTGERSKKTGWLAFFVASDVLFIGLDLTIICLLSQAGLPRHCSGLTSPDSPPPPDFTTLGFSDEGAGHHGQLDHLCAFERSFFFISIGLIFSYIHTIVFTVLRVGENYYTKISRFNEVSDALARAMEEASEKKSESSSPLMESAAATTTRLGAARPPPPPPPSEGIITRNTSVRSTMTAATATAPQRAAAVLIATTPLRPANLPPMMSPSSMSNRLGISMNMGMGHHHQTGGGFVPVPLDEEGDNGAAEAALVADGMQHRYRQQREEQQQQQQQQMPMLLEVEQTAESALVSDGMRSSEPMLPPYEPNRNHMVGHGLESNDMRLSEYVKGETRAQDMKDSGRY